MNDRLDELRKQRALVQQHLTWLDHEIAAVTVTRMTLPPFAFRKGSKAPMPAPTPGGVPPAGGVAIPELAEFQVDPDNVHGDTRKGCILYAALALGILFLICFAIYFFGYRDHPVLIVPEKTGSNGTMVYPAGAPKPAPAKQPPAPQTPPPK